MSRRSQDIPIRPRWGCTEDGNGGDAGATTTATAASYTEIPFLAQYPGPVPEHVLNDITPTATAPNHPTDNDSYLNLDSGDDDEEDDDDVVEEEEDDDSNSKDSSGERRRRPQSLLHCDANTYPYELDGTTSNTGEMRHFVAHNLEAKLRERSPPRTIDSGHTTPSTSTAAGGGGGGEAAAPGMMTRRFLQSRNIPEIDGNVLSDIELEAQYLATAVDNLVENLGNLLHSISSITADNVEVHKNAVNKLTDTLDGNIKCMYTIMAKTEEISKSMRPTEQLAGRIREIKRLVDMLDNAM